MKFNRRCGVQMIEQVRNTFPDLVMHIDCNSGFTLDDVEIFRSLDQLDLKMIEQPLGYDDLIDHAELQRELLTPICLDESITSVNRAAKAIKIGACRWINIKTSRVGGLTNALAIHDLCMAKDIPTWVGGMLESAVGQGHSLALATKDNVSYPCDIFPSSRFFWRRFFSSRDHLFRKRANHRTGNLPAPVSIQKMDFLKRHNVATATIKKAR